MILQIFTVYDSAAKAFLQPFFAPTIEAACRMFRQAVNGDGPFNEFPEDYTLFHVGWFNQETGFVSAEEAPHSVGVAITFLNKPRLIGHGEEEITNAS